MKSAESWVNSQRGEWCVEAIGETSIAKFVRAIQADAIEAAARECENGALVNDGLADEPQRAGLEAEYFEAMAKGLRNGARFIRKLAPPPPPVGPTPRKPEDPLIVVYPGARAEGETDDAPRVQRAVDLAARIGADSIHIPAPPPMG